MTGSIFLMQQLLVLVILQFESLLCVKGKPNMVYNGTEQQCCRIEIVCGWPYIKCCAPSINLHFTVAVACDAGPGFSIKIRITIGPVKNLDLKRCIIATSLLQPSRRQLQLCKFRQITKNLIVHKLWWCNAMVFCC